MKENISIEIDRESVSQSDDKESHLLNISVSKEITFINLFEYLVEKKYFPNIIENNAVWILTHDGGDSVAWIVKYNKYITHFIEDDIKFNLLKNSTEIRIKFFYYTSQLERAKYIYKKFQGVKFYIWHENYMKEYEYYNISEELENKWFEEVSNKK